MENQRKIFLKPWWSIRSNVTAFKSLIWNQCLFVFFFHLFIKVNEKLHCPKFLNMETFKTTLWIMRSPSKHEKKVYYS